MMHTNPFFSFMSQIREHLEKLLHKQSPHQSLESLSYLHLQSLVDHILTEEKSSFIRTEFERLESLLKMAEKRYGGLDKDTGVIGRMTGDKGDIWGTSTVVQVSRASGKEGGVSKRLEMEVKVPKTQSRLTAWLK